MAHQMFTFSARRRPRAAFLPSYYLTQSAGGPENPADPGTPGRGWVVPGPVTGPERGPDRRWGHPDHPKVIQIGKVTGFPTAQKPLNWPHGTLGIPRPAGRRRPDRATARSRLLPGRMLPGWPRPSDSRSAASLSCRDARPSSRPHSGITPGSAAPAPQGTMDSGFGSRQRSTIWPATTATAAASSGTGRSGLTRTRRCPWPPSRMWYCMPWGAWRRRPRRPSPPRLCGCTASRWSCSRPSSPPTGRAGSERPCTSWICGQNPSWRSTPSICLGATESAMTPRSISTGSAGWTS